MQAGLVARPEFDSLDELPIPEMDVDDRTDATITMVLREHRAFPRVCRRVLSLVMTFVDPSSHPATSANRERIWDVRALLSDVPAASSIPTQFGN